MLKREFDLLALKVRMDTRQDVRVRCTLEAHEGGERHEARVWDWPPEAFGLPARLAGGSREGERRGPRDRRFELPPALIDGLRGWLADEDQQGRVLWLHLAPPKGYLAALPWERLLQPEIDAPVLRLPDFFQRPPRETPRSLSVALCGSAPLAKGGFGLASRMAELAAIYADAPRKERRIHLFTDRDHFSEVAEMAGRAAEDLGAELVAHDPEGAAPFDVPDATSRITDPGGQLQNPWLMWMRDALAGRSVDVVHLLGHGYLWSDRGAFSFASSPWHEDDPRWARFVGAEELLGFTTQVGAWSLAFSAPRRNYSRVGLRLLADRLADLRPGPVLLHELAADPDMVGLRTAVDFLYAPGPGRPPASPALSLWCQPYRVRRAVGEAALEGGETWIQKGQAVEKAILPSIDTLESATPLQAVYGRDEPVPGWVAASERYVEQRVLGLKKQAEAGSLPTDFDTDAFEGVIERLQVAMAKGAAAEGMKGAAGSGEMDVGGPKETGASGDEDDGAVPDRPSGSGGAP
jgi:hypothetical protein